MDWKSNDKKTGNYGATTARSLFSTFFLISRSPKRDNTLKVDDTAKEGMI